ncbi:MAG: YHS domain-containing protein [Gemmatimonadota bacterium]|nr:YHS domain-containing protein [Gemmatimonadota bacterium]
MMVRDEVCGMEFDSEAAVATARLNARTYYFCSDRCKRLFVEHPERYVAVEPGGAHRTT